MWENAAPLPENEPPRPPARCAGSEEDLVLWAQILLCLAAIGLVLAAGALDWPVYPELRRAFAAAMQPEQSLLLSEERSLLKFTEQTAGELADSARSMWEDFTLPATPESARTAHGQPSPPAYARTDSYMPGFPLQFPLPGQSRKTSGYGWRTDPMGGLGDDFHIGNDLAAAQGTPVLAAADVGVAMGGLGSDAAMEAADVVIMTDEISRLPLAIRIARKTMAIARQNIIFSIAVKILILALSLITDLGLWLAVFADVGVCMLAILNSLRALHTK